MADVPVPHYTKEHVDSGAWASWRKRVTTKAVRIYGPFTVETREGPLSCPDGYLAVDSQGWPYPIAKDEFETIYGPAND